MQYRRQARLGVQRTANADSSDVYEYSGLPRHLPPSLLLVLSLAPMLLPSMDTCNDAQLPYSWEEANPFVDPQVNIFNLSSQEQTSTSCKPNEPLKQLDWSVFIEYPPTLIPQSPVTMITTLDDTSAQTASPEVTSARTSAGPPELAGERAETLGNEKLGQEPVHPRKV